MEGRKGLLGPTKLLSVGLLCHLAAKQANVSVTVRGETVLRPFPSFSPSSTLGCSSLAPGSVFILSPVSTAISHYLGDAARLAEQEASPSCPLSIPHPLPPGETKAKAAPLTAACFP